MSRRVARESRGIGRWLAAAPLVVLLLYGVAPSYTSGLREDEVQCEEAKMHLLDCCSPFTGVLECEFIDHGCGVTLPDLEVGESRAIQGRSCDELGRDGSCETNFTERRAQ